MNLPVMPPVAPMLATLARELPTGEGLVYEPKWDGFRCVVFRDGRELELVSRNERSLDRYFPELREGLLRVLPPRCVVDGEIVIVGPTGLDFDALLQRIHPAESRVKTLAKTAPASFVAFDLLANGEDDLRGEPFALRRHGLEDLLGRLGPPVYVTPSTRDPERAAEWFEHFEGAGLDGVVVKRADLPYREGERAMVKVKHERTADCVAGGFRWHKEGGIGSILLGLHDGSGLLHHVGVAIGFSAHMRSALAPFLEPLRTTSPDHPWLGVPRCTEQRRPGAPNRFSRGKDTAFEAIEPALVLEVRFDHLQGDRFRHATKFVRWRPERDPASCTYDQLETAVPAVLESVFRK